MVRHHCLANLLRQCLWIEGVRKIAGLAVSVGLAGLVE
jgi:hypothetical protein